MGKWDEEIQEGSMELKTFEKCPTGKVNLNYFPLHVLSLMFKF